MMPCNLNAMATSFSEYVCYRTTIIADMCRIGFECIHNTSCAFNFVTQTVYRGITYNPQTDSNKFTRCFHIPQLFEYQLKC